MPPPNLFEDKIPERFQNYHFMIRGCTSPDRVEYMSNFDRFLKQIFDNRSLRTAQVHIQDREVAFIRLESSNNSGHINKNIKRLCWCITSLRNRAHLDIITTRSILGVSPASDDTLINWVEAIFRGSLEHGPSYLSNMKVKKDDHIPNWAIVLSFSMIAGINIAGYKSIQYQRNTSTQTNINDKMIAMFGQGGVEAGGNFLKTITSQNMVRFTLHSLQTSVAFENYDELSLQDAPDLEELRDTYPMLLESVEFHIDQTFQAMNKIQAATPRNRDDIVRCYARAVLECYDATLLAASAMLTESQFLEAYLTARITEAQSVDGIPHGIAAVAFLTNAALACEVTAASWTSLSAWGAWWSAGAWFTAGSWPTVLTIAHPAGLAISAVGLTILGISAFTQSARKRDILRHQNLSLLISRACNVINEATILVMCIYHLDSDARQGATDCYLQRLENDEFLQLWRAFVEEDNQRREQRRRERGRAHRRSGRKSDQSSAQRQLSRYIQELTSTQGSKLRDCLLRFRKTGELDPSTSEESNEERSRVESDDDGLRDSLNN